jgi:adenylate cyclase
MNTYVGPRTGQRVIDGFIERGSFEQIEAAIWLADLRGFTRLSETAPVKNVIATLNDWCETMIVPIEQHGGEILKFIGDAVLAIFPTSEQRSRENACANAFAAGEQFTSAWHEEKERGDFTLALHFGEVAYGNIGAPHRLDFTVIGPSVNRAARLQELAKTLGYSAVMSSALAEHLPDGRVHDLGHHKVRDIQGAQHVFTADWARKLHPEI